MPSLANENDYFRKAAGFPVVTATPAELRALKHARREYLRGETITLDEYDAQPRPGWCTWVAPCKGSSTECPATTATPSASVSLSDSIKALLAS